MNKKTIILSFILVLIFMIFLYTNSRKEPGKVKVYFLQIGAFQNSENVTKLTKFVNHNYVEYDEGIYFVYVGITNSEKTLEKLKNMYNTKGNNIYVKEKEIINSEFIKELKKYDQMILDTNNDILIESLEKEILLKYKETT